MPPSFLPRFTLSYWLKLFAGFHDDDIAPAGLEIGGLAMDDGLELKLPEFLRVVEIPLLAEQVGDDGAAVLLGREQRG